jgi:hypothetical protein
VTESSLTSDQATYLRELALIDKVIGLEAEVARLSIAGSIQDHRTLHDSRAWRVGMFVLSPVIFARRIVAKFR